MYLGSLSTVVVVKSQLAQAGVLRTLQASLLETLRLVEELRKRKGTLTMSQMEAVPCGRMFGSEIEATQLRRMAFDTVHLGLLDAI